MKETHSPICPRQCDLSKPHCPRGKTYAKTGVIPQMPKQHDKRLHFKQREHQLIMKYLHHAIKAADSGHITQNMTDDMFNVFSKEETTEFLKMLEKLSDYWIELAHKE